LTVPGVCRLLQQSSGLVTTHSSLNILAWYLRKPQLLLYPPHTAAAHFSPTSDPRWSFGRDYPETTHCPFAAFTPAHLARFLASLP
jgi:ADP-heptose:LPS heptosyltransferase